MTDPKPYRHRFPMTIIQHAVWLYHRFPISYRDVQELLHQRGIQVSHETLREWCIKFGPLFAEHLRHREPRRGSRWHLDEVCTTVDGIRHWLWRAVDEYGFVLDILLQRHRDTEAAKTFLTRLLGEYDVPEVIRTDQLQSYGAAIREIPSLVDVDHQAVISKARRSSLSGSVSDTTAHNVMSSVDLRFPSHPRFWQVVAGKAQPRNTKSRWPELQATCCTTAFQLRSAALRKERRS